MHLQSAQSTESAQKMTSAVNSWVVPAAGGSVVTGNLPHSFLVVANNPPSGPATAALARPH
ncbi:MAG: hypothetical protein QOE07_1796 [Acidimicrobiaceae bacterium]|nr:hypothetical protein [Acidimicrobiaceae bacterium]